MPRRQLIYEEDCRLCAASAQWIAARAGGDLEAVPFGDPQVPPELDADRSRAHLVEEGHVLHGGAAMTGALRAAGYGWIAKMFDLPGVAVVRDTGYAAFSRFHRRRRHED